MNERSSRYIRPPVFGDGDEGIRGVVARPAVLDQLVRQLARVAPRGKARHQLILGPHGSGKTSLLRQLAAAVEGDRELAGRFIPLVCREAPYNVHSLETFWRNALEALADGFERSGQPDKAARLDREVAALPREAGASQSLFHSWTAPEKRRPLLLLDNFELVFQGLKREREGLLEQMGRPGGLVIVAASAAGLEDLMAPVPEMRAQMEVTVLEPLDAGAAFGFLQGLASARYPDGEEDPGEEDDDDLARIRTLYDLAGGQPGMLVHLDHVLQLDLEGDLVSALELVLDTQTARHEARIEALAPQARVVLDAVALAWDPVLAADVAVATGLEVALVSSQLDRLLKDGLLEKVTVSRTSKSAFQVTDRPFNIWYLLRHGTRQHRERLRGLIGFVYNQHVHEAWLAGADESQIQGRRTDIQALQASAFVAGYLKEDFGQALRLYCRVMKLDPGDSAARGHVAVLEHFAGDAKGQQIDEASIAGHPPAGRALMRLLVGMRDGRPGAALAQVGAVFDAGDGELFARYRGPMLLLLREVARKGWGDLLLRMLEESSVALDLWPMRMAYQAHLCGAVRLEDINPEARVGAIRLLAQLSATY